jgi:hypothetical protein
MPNIVHVVERLDRLIELTERLLTQLQAPTNLPTIVSATVAEPPIAAPSGPQEPHSGDPIPKRRGRPPKLRD